MRRLACFIALITVASIAWAQSKPATSQPTTKPTGGTLLPPGQILDSLLKPPSASGQALQPIVEGPVMDKTSGAGAVFPGAPQINLVREGSYIVDRTGRLNRSADGTTAELTFDADGKALKDPPMVILPNLKLVQMENAVTSSSRDIRFKVTGMVTEYKGRNYILLEKVVVVPDSTQQF